MQQDQVTPTAEDLNARNDVLHCHGCTALLETLTHELSLEP